MLWLCLLFSCFLMFLFRLSLFGVCAWREGALLHLGWRGTYALVRLGADGGLFGVAEVTPLVDALVTCFFPFLFSENFVLFKEFSPLVLLDLLFLLRLFEPHQVLLAVLDLGEDLAARLLVIGLE